MEDDGYHLTLHGLLRKRAELTSTVAALRAELDRVLSGLDAIDTAIRVFRPDIDSDLLPERPAPPASAAFRGEVQRFLLSALRAAKGPMTTTQLAYAVMESRRLNTDDRVLAVLIRKRTGHSLGRLRKGGYVEGERYGLGPELEWRVSARGASEDWVGGWRNGTTGALNRSENVDHNRDDRQQHLDTSPAPSRLIRTL